MSRVLLTQKKIILLEKSSRSCTNYCLQEGIKQPEKKDEPSHIFYFDETNVNLDQGRAKRVTAVSQNFIYALKNPLKRTITTAINNISKKQNLLSTT